MLDIFFLSTNIIEVHFLRRKKQLNGPLGRDGFQFFLLISKRQQLYRKGFFKVC